MYVCVCVYVCMFTLYKHIYFCMYIWYMCMMFTIIVTSWLRGKVESGGKTWMNINFENWTKISKWPSETLSGNFLEKKLSTLQSRHVYPRPVLPDFKNSARFSSVWERDLANVEPKRNSPKKNLGRIALIPLMAVRTWFFTISGWNQLGSNNLCIMFISHVFTSTTFKSELSRAHDVYMSCRCKSRTLFWVLFNTFGRSALDLLGIPIGI